MDIVTRVAVLFFAMSASIQPVASGSKSAFVGATSALPTDYIQSRESHCPLATTRCLSGHAAEPLLSRGNPSQLRMINTLGPEPSMRKAVMLSGGATSPVKADDAGGFGLGSTWGVVSVVFILMNAVKRLAPIALQPFSRGDFTNPQWAMYWGFSLFMAYAEGFKGFQSKFSPLVVKRALTLDKQPTFSRLLLAGPYSMGLFHATKKRQKVSWGLTTGVFALVQLVKRLPYPWRSIVDAGVVVGLSYGTASIAVIWARALLGRAPAIDPALPESRA